MFIACQTWGKNSEGELTMFDQAESNKNLYYTWVFYSFYYMPFCDIMVFEPPSLPPPFHTCQQLCNI